MAWLRRAEEAGRKGGIEGRRKGVASKQLQETENRSGASWGLRLGDVIVGLGELGVHTPSSTFHVGSKLIGFAWLRM